MRDVELKGAAGILTLMNIKGIGEVTADNIVGRFSTFEEVLNAPDEAFKKLVTVNTVAKLRDGQVLADAYDAARRVLDYAASNDVDLITLYDERYPVRLYDCNPKPMMLYVKGNLQTAERSVACVGTREPTKYGEIAADRITTFLAENGWAIVSGLAKGIDSLAHEAALRAGVPTIAILGCGLNAIDPKRKYAIELGDRILAAGGCVVSEQPFGRENDAFTLIRRNRIQCGLAVATFMLQCDVDSGTMHTVRYSLLQGRPVYAPKTPSHYADEEKNRGADIITSRTGIELSKLIEMKQELRELVYAEFAERPVASAIAGKDDYERVLEELEQHLTNNRRIVSAEQRLF